MYPRTSNPGFYPPDEVISRETTRNREAVLILEEAADCVYRVIGKQAQYCGGAPPATTVFSDDFETDRGWTERARPTRPPPARWERGDPGGDHQQRRQAARHDGERHNDLVTGAAAGAAAGDFDIDGGTTTITSPAITLTGGTHYNLSLSWYLAHGSNASSADFFRVQVNGADAGAAPRGGREPQRRVDELDRLARRVRRADDPDRDLRRRRVDREPGRGGRRRREGDKGVATINSAIARMPSRFGCSGAAALAGTNGSTQRSPGAAHALCPRLAA